MQIAPTFRDPDGFCFSSEGRVFRVVYPHAEKHFRNLLVSKFLQDLIAAGQVPATRELSWAEIDELKLEEPIRSRLKASEFVLEHGRLPFVSYPHEWCSEMLFAAGELTLELQLRAMDANLTLKDATPRNVVFDGSRPVFVDLLSFTPRFPGQTIWPAYAQFIRSFLLPLLLHRRHGGGTHGLFLANQDGVEAEEAYARLSWIHRLLPSSLQYVSLPRWLGNLSIERAAFPTHSAQMDDERARQVSAMVVRRLQRSFRRFRPQLGRSSTWSDYILTNSYHDSASKSKEIFVAKALAKLAPKTVLDVGCNTGHFSEIAGAAGALVVSLDCDPVVIGRLWHKSQVQGISILPLVINLARPSPGLGWRNAEASSFLARALGQFDVALLLAVVHHLSVVDGIGLRELFRLMAEVVTKGLIVEYVPPTDSMFQKIIRNKEHLVPKLGRSGFEMACDEFFTTLSVEVLPDSGRVLYCLAKR